MIKKWLKINAKRPKKQSHTAGQFFAVGHLQPEFDAKNAEDVRLVLDYLLNTPPKDATHARSWFGLFQELSMSVTELHSQLELNTHLDVQSSEHSNALREFESGVLTLILNARLKLTDIYLACSWKHAMHSDDKGLLQQDLLRRIPLAQPTLAKWQLEEAQLVQKYKQIYHRSTAVWQSRTVSLAVVNGFLSHSSEAIRKEAFYVYWGALSKNKNEYQNLFCNLGEVRKAIASHAGYDHYAQCAFVETGKASYSPRDSVDFNNVLLAGQERYLAPLLRSMGNDSCLPWNYTSLASMLPGHPPCNGNLDDLLMATSKMMDQIHPSCGQLYSDLQTAGRLDVHPRGNKAGGAFCVNFSKSKIPFIFGNFSARLKDAMTLVHEFGHAYHSHLSSFIANHLLRTPSMEFCEFAASSFELLALEHLKHWYKNPSHYAAAQKQHLVGVISFFPLMCSIDDFQHQIYDPSEDLTANAISQVWTKVSRKHRSQIDWSTCPEFEELGWLCRSHIFTTPFYFFEYGVAYLGALDFISKYKSQPDDALHKFMGALQLGAQRPLPDLFEAAGIYFALQKAEKQSDRAVMILEQTLDTIFGLN